MERFWKYKIDHWFFWVATIFFHIYTRLPLLESAGPVQFTIEILLRNSLLAGVIYLNLLVLIPRFSQQKKYGLYILFLLLSLTLYILAKNTHDTYLYGYILNDSVRGTFWNNTLYNFSIVIFYLAFSVALQLSKEWYFQRQLIQKIEIEKLNTELEYLKSQINPHFLFNSINTIYFQIDKANTSARETLSSFSEMLRYQLYECNGHEISILKEINYLRNYVELQRLRKDENYTIDFKHADDFNGMTIAPLLLIPFVENAFKHVSHFTETTNQIKIELSRKEDVFTLYVFNTKDRNVKQSQENGGIGLKNVRRRLDLLYQDKYNLDISENQESFEVKLQLKMI